MDDHNRIRKLMLLGNDPLKDLEFIRADVIGELKRRGVTDNQIEGVELAVNVAFALGEKNAALKIARGEEL
jgi:hypothetical protein